MYSPSDGEPIAPDHPLFASAKAVPERQSDNTALITQLSQLVYSQQQEIYQLREEQRSNFMAIQQLLQSLGTTLSESQRLTLSEFSKEQRILKNHLTQYVLVILFVCCWFP